MSPPQDLTEAASLRNGGVPRFRDSPSSWTGAQWMSGFCLMCARHGTECASRNAPREAWHHLLAGSQPHPPGCSESGAFCSCPQCRRKGGLLSVSRVSSGTRSGGERGTGDLGGRAWCSAFRAVHHPHRHPSHPATPIPSTFPVQLRPCHSLGQSPAQSPGITS